MIAKRILYSAAVLALVSILAFVFLHNSEEVTVPDPSKRAKPSKKAKPPKKPKIKLVDNPKIEEKPEALPKLRPKTISTGIHGRVSDEATGLPITNAKLSIKSVSQVTVDQLGRFSIPAPLREQKWAVVVRAKGYHPKLFEALATRGL
ncbi:MAG: carboxypeptidase regulatory-like domain-containing protein, partial [Planctomycetota bacterium]|nr:carboxypeptidase regulatory-like domain-containing protein [Planctomycetota bacterium]